MKLVILAHPWEKSFNHAIKNEIIQKFTLKGENYFLIDLYDDLFNPVLSKKELEMFKDGLAIDEKVLHYQKILSSSNELIIIFPIWWYSLPAILKGFFDKVMLKGFSYTETSTGLVGKLTNIERATIITTSESPTWYIRLFKGNFVKGVFKKGILRDIGINKIRWINFPNIKSATQNSRKKFLKGLNV